MPAAACGDALEAVAPHLPFLGALKATSAGQGSNARQKLQDRCSATIIKQHLLAVGEHIEGHGWPAWLDCYFGIVTLPQLWHAVSGLARHRGGGMQLNEMFTAASKRQRQLQGASASDGKQS
jgi:hypothetical protein